MDRVLCVIPARYASTRLPGKPLIKIAGVSLIERVWRQVSRARRPDAVVVATDHPEIVAEVERFGGRAMMTDPRHPSGSDRLAEVAGQMEHYGIILNVQGDEPLISPDNIDRLASALAGDRAVPMASLMTVMPQAEWLEPAAVKVVVDDHGYALYFSRSLIPFPRNPVAGLPVYKHVGIYAYRREFLLQFAAWPPARLEVCEGLEQLRALARGVKIKMIYTDEVSVGVDTWQDLRVVEDMLSNDNR
ncbi:MAG: 3-deoxy-manno-octulosonate cytidylyltransferase [Negativicutes bacterium]|nr:3-deoxy-manno-octulosonate cytidylyltransferase [Negativicutes bacterium]